MNYKIFIYNLLCLILPIFAIFAWFSYDSLEGSPGGSYDLGDLYKSILIIAFLILFEIIFVVRIFALFRSTKKFSVESKATFFIALGMLIYFSVNFLSNLK